MATLGLRRATTRPLTTQAALALCTQEMGAVGGQNMKLHRYGRRTPAQPGLLLARAAHGDEVAFARFYDRTVAAVHGLIGAIIVEPPEAEEITRCAYVQMWRQAARFDPASDDPTGWALKIALDAALVRSQTMRLPGTRPHDPRSARSDSPSTVIDRWPGVLVQLAVHTDLSCDEIADLLDSEPAAIRTQLRNQLIQLGHSHQADTTPTRRPGTT